MSRLRLATLATLVVLGACGSPIVPPAQNYATIAGRVFDAQTNVPISGARVTALVVLTAVSAADGTYRIANVPSGHGAIAVQPPAGSATPAAGSSTPPPEPGRANPLLELTQEFLVALGNQGASRLRFPVGRLAGLTLLRHRGSPCR